MPLSALRWFKAALVLQALLLAYWLATEALELFPWNDLAARPAGYDLGQSIAATALPQLGFIALFALGIRAIGFIPVVGYTIWLGLQLWTWWLPWLTATTADWRSRYEASFARTLKLIPYDGITPVADAQHLALQALTLVTLIATAMAVARMQHL